MTHRRALQLDTDEQNKHDTGGVANILINGKCLSGLRLFGGGELFAASGEPLTARGNGCRTR